MRVCVYVCVCACVCDRERKRERERERVCERACVRVCVCVCACIYMHTHTPIPMTSTKKRVIRHAPQRVRPSACFLEARSVVSLAPHACSAPALRGGNTPPPLALDDKILSIPGPSAPMAVSDRVTFGICVDERDGERVVAVAAWLRGPCRSWCSMRASALLFCDRALVLASE